MMALHTIKFYRNIGNIQTMTVKWNWQKTRVIFPRKNKHLVSISNLSQKSCYPAHFPSGPQYCLVYDIALLADNLLNILLILINESM